MTKKVQSCVRLQAESEIQKSKNFRNFEIQKYFSFLLFFEKSAHFTVKAKVFATSFISFCHYNNQIYPREVISNEQGRHDQ